LPFLARVDPSQQLGDRSETLHFGQTGQFARLSTMALVSGHDIALFTSPFSFSLSTGSA
jgi:hypothetical protein